MQEASRWALGLAAGGIAGLLNFYLLYRQLSQSLRGERGRARVTAGFVGRYALLAGMFFLAFRWSWLHLGAFLAGFTLVQVALGAVSLRRLIRSAKN